MKAIRILTVFIIVLCANHLTYGATKKTRIFVVSSYHQEYLWSQDTHRGVCAALLDFGFYDDEGQVGEYTKNDYVESSKAVVKKVWMDTKRKSSRKEIAVTI
jgi:hypothetical protein